MDLQYYTRLKNGVPWSYTYHEFGNCIWTTLLLHMIQLKNRNRRINNAHIPKRVRVQQLCDELCVYQSLPWILTLLVPTLMLINIIISWAVLILHIGISTHYTTSSLRMTHLFASLSTWVTVLFDFMECQERGTSSAFWLETLSLYVDLVLRLIFPIYCTFPP